MLDWGVLVSFFLIKENQAATFGVSEWPGVQEDLLIQK